MDKILIGIVILSLVVWAGMMNLLVYSFATLNVFLLKSCVIYWLMNIATFFIIWSTDFKPTK